MCGVARIERHPAAVPATFAPPFCPEQLLGLGESALDVGELEAVGAVAPPTVKR